MKKLNKLGEHWFAEGPDIMKNTVNDLVEVVEELQGMIIRYGVVSMESPVSIHTKGERRYSLAELRDKWQAFPGFLKGDLDTDFFDWLEEVDNA